MSYDELRHFADSWGLIFMGFSFVVLVGWAFRPGSRKRSNRAAKMIFGEDDHG